MISGAKRRSRGVRAAVVIVSGPWSSQSVDALISAGWIAAVVSTSRPESKKASSRSDSWR